MKLNHKGINTSKGYGIINFVCDLIPPKSWAVLISFQFLLFLYFI